MPTLLYKSASLFSTLRSRNNERNTLCSRFFYMYGKASSPFSNTITFQIYSPRLNNNSLLRLEPQGVTIEIKSKLSQGHTGSEKDWKGKISYIRANFCHVFDSFKAIEATFWNFY